MSVFRILGLAIDFSFCSSQMGSRVGVYRFALELNSGLRLKTTLPNYTLNWHATHGSSLESRERCEHQLVQTGGPELREREDRGDPANQSMTSVQAPLTLLQLSGRPLPLQTLGTNLLHNTNICFKPHHVCRNTNRKIHSPALVYVRSLRLWTISVLSKHHTVTTV